MKAINPIWFFDASGGMFKNVDKKSNFLYSAVMHDYVNQKIIPAFEFVTNNHTESNLKIYLSRVKDMFNDEVAPFVVVDEAWPSINAISSIFNNCDILSYINWTWDVIHTDIGANEVFHGHIKTRIILCHVHLSRNFLYKCEQLILEVSNYVKKKAFFIFHNVILNINPGYLILKVLK